MFRKLALAFSVANLCFFKAWRDVLSPQVIAYLYLWKQNPGFVSLLALIINVLALTAVFYLGFTLAWRRAGPFLQNCLRLAFLVIFLRSLNGVRIQFNSLSTGQLRLVFGRVGFFALGMSLLALLILIIARYGIVSVTRVAAVVALILSPLGLVAATQGTVQAIKYNSLVSQERQPTPLIPASRNPGPRVLWVIFDEMSSELAFGRRPPELELREFDRLQDVALSAANAYPPAGRTMQSIPALLTGQLVAATKPAGPDELLLTFAGQSEAVGWSQQQDIFSAARAMHLNAAVVGWYHPYCRVIGDRLTRCFWQSASQLTNPEKFDVARMMLVQDADALQLLPFTGRVREWILNKTPDYRTPHVVDYLELVDRAARLAADPDIKLAFVHLPVPHPPYIYDRHRGVWDTTGERSYLDNLALADHALGQLRTAMERTGIWDTTTVVISSDHWWRTEYWDIRKPIWSPADDSYRGEGADHRIPFLIKLGGQKTGSRYEAPFNTVLTHDLVLDVLNGKVSGAEQVTAWLDTHRSIGESPFQAYDDSP
jgi:hypothetical protein